MAIQQTTLDALSTHHLHADLKGRSVRGGLVTLGSQGVQFVMQSVATIVLARLLSPADFGAVAMVTAITGLASAFADFGLSEATIQRKEITHEQVSTLFWINLAIGLGLTLITAGLGPVLAIFYREPRLIRIALFLSLTFFLGGLRVQPNALLKRQMRFSALAFRDIAAYMTAVPIAILLAWRGAGYWTLVAMPLILNFVQMALSWMMVKWRPGLPRRGSQVRSMLTFGGNISASYLIFNLNRSFDSILIGWYWGAAPLGLYSRAYNLLMLPVRQLSTPAGNVTIPAFSRLQEDPERFARYYLRAIGLIIWITAPIFGFLFVAAKPVVVLVLGAKWSEAAPVFQFLVISALGQILIESTIWLLVSRGQSSRLLKLLLIISPILVCSFAIGLPFGIKGVALSGSLVLLGILPWVLKFTFRGTNLTLLRLGRAIVYPIALCFFGVILANVCLHFAGAVKITSQLLVDAMGFILAFSISALIPGFRAEIASLKDSLGALGFSRRTTVWPVTQ
jgi:O-antigen/teichoic acid export membrane protein